MNPTQTDSHLTTDRPTLTAKGDSSRCQHRYSNGKRCRLSGSESQLGLCSHHFRLSAAETSGQQAPSDSLDLSADLLPELTGSGVRADLRQFLTRLLVLVTQGRVTPRRLPFSPTSPTNSFTLTALPLRKHLPRRRAPNRDQSLTVRRPALDNRCAATHDATQLLLPTE